MCKLINSRPRARKRAEHVASASPEDSCDGPRSEESSENSRQFEDDSEERELVTL